MIAPADRRAVLAGGGALLGMMALKETGFAATTSPGGVRLGPPKPFSFDGLIARAKAIAAQPYKAPPAPDPLLEQIDFDAYGQIAFDPKMTLWGGEGEPAVQLFSLGRYFKTPVDIGVVSGGTARAIVYEPRLFQAPASNPFHRLKQGGFAGFRAMNHDEPGDWLSFLGASYFRAAAPFNQYGASARGLSIDSGGPAPEEFPRFSALWLEKGPDRSLVTYALLEGPSVCGAYRIDSRKGAGGATQGVDAVLFFRRPVETYGVGQITSMFWYGENNPAARRDWRPEIHDSDGLALWTGAGERIWRPLTDPPRIVTYAFQDKDPKGFGLLQRDRVFDHYQDDGAFYEKRPSVWIEPLAPFGEGSVRLLEMPTDKETDDNIGAFWAPGRPAVAGAETRFKYRIHWTGDQPGPFLPARAMATRTGVAGRPGMSERVGYRRMVVDFAGDSLKGLTRQSGVDAVVTASGGAAIDQIAVYPVVGTDLWRLVFEVKVPDTAPTDIRAYLRRNGAALSETWLYALFPEK
jgi:glucans biosynthesis protein